MKYIILILLFSVNCFAANNWFPVGKAGAKTTYVKKQKCEQVEGQSCYDISEKDIRYWEVQTVNVDDTSNPIMKAAYNSGSCNDPEDCSTKMGDAMVSSPCDSGDNYTYKQNELMPGYTYYCTRLLGYEQIAIETLVENASLKSTVQAADAAKAAEESAIQGKLKDMDYGKLVIAKMGLKSDGKGLSPGQRKQLIDDYESVFRLLRAGSINAARDTINGMTPDGTRVTTQDKTDILTELDAYLGN